MEQEDGPNDEPTTSTTIKNGSLNIDNTEQSTSALSDDLGDISLKQDEGYSAQVNNIGDDQAPKSEQESHQDDNNNTIEQGETQDLPIFQEYGVKYSSFMNLIHENSFNEASVIFQAFINSPAFDSIDENISSDQVEPLFKIESAERFLITQAHSEQPWFNAMNAIITLSECKDVEQVPSIWRRMTMKKPIGYQVKNDGDELFPGPRRRSLQKSLSSSALVEQSTSPDLIDSNSSSDHPYFDPETCKKLLYLSSDELGTMSMDQLKQTRKDLMIMIKEAYNSQKHLNEQKNRLKEAILMNNKMIEGLVARAQAAKSTSNPCIPILPSRPSSPLKWI